MSNQPLELSTLFIYSYLDEDSHVDSSPSADLQHTNDDKPDGRKAVRGVLVRSRDVGGKQEREVTYLPRFFYALFSQFMLFFLLLIYSYASFFKFMSQITFTVSKCHVLAYFFFLFSFSKFVM